MYTSPTRGFIRVDVTRLRLFAPPTPTATPRRDLWLVGPYTSIFARAIQKTSFCADLLLHRFEKADTIL